MHEVKHLVDVKLWKTILIAVVLIFLILMMRVLPWSSCLITTGEERNCAIQQCILLRLRSQLHVQRARHVPAQSVGMAPCLGQSCAVAQCAPLSSCHPPSGAHVPAKARRTPVDVGTWHASGRMRMPLVGVAADADADAGVWPRAAADGVGVMMSAPATAAVDTLHVGVAADADARVRA